MSGGISGLGGASFAGDLPEVDGPPAPAPVAASAPAAPAGSLSPLGTWTLAGHDPVRGNYTGSVTIAPAPGGAGNVKVTYDAKFADGREGRFVATGSSDKSGHVWADAPLSSATGVFAPGANPGAAPDARVDLTYAIDGATGSATGSVHLEGVPAPAGVEFPDAVEAIARPGAGVALLGGSGGTGGLPGLGGPLPTSLASALGLLDEQASAASIDVGAPLQALSGVPLPGAQSGLSLSSPAGNQAHVGVDMTDGASPKVSIWFDQPLTVKGPWYQPDVKISSIWLDGGSVKTDASFSSDILNAVPGLGSLPDKMARKAIAQAEGSFGPVMQLLGAQAQAGHLADPTAVAAALGQALDPATLANAPANPLAGKVDVTQATVTASATLKGAFSQTQNGVVVTAPAGMTVTANLPVNGATQAVRGPLTLSFSPGIQVAGAGTGLGADLVNLANASVTGITVAPDGRVTLGGDSIGIAKGVLDDRLSEESQRATAILAVVLRELPPGSPIAEALAKAGVRPS